MAEKKPKQSKTDKNGKKQETGNRRSLDLAIPLYIERILVEETCGTETKRNSNKGWISAPKIAELLETRYGVKCSTTVVRDNYLPALENYYNKNANNKNLEGTQRPAYRFERKQKEGGTIWCRLTSDFSPEEALYSLAMLPSEADIDSFSNYALYPFGAEQRELLTNMAKPFYRPYYLETDSGPKDKSKVTLYNFKLICQAMSEGRAVKQITIRHVSADACTDALKERGQTNEDGTINYPVTQFFVPLFLGRTAGKTIQVFSLKPAKCAQLAQEQLPEWINGRYPEWPPSAEWPHDNIMWPPFQCQTIDLYSHLELGRKLSISPSVFEKLQGLAYLQSRTHGRTRGGAPILVRIKEKDGYSRNREYMRSRRDLIKDNFEDCPCFKVSHDGVYEFVINSLEIMHWFRIFSRYFELLGPQELIDDIRKSEERRAEMVAHRKERQKAQKAALEATKAAEEAAKQAEKAAKKVAEALRAAEKAASSYEFAEVNLPKD